jgi:hypothetical protein
MAAPSTISTEDEIEGSSHLSCDALSGKVAHDDTRSRNLRMSSAFHAVILGPSFIGLGNRPVLMPAHHVDLPTGIGPFGARIEESRTKPVSGKGGERDICASLA